MKVNKKLIRKPYQQGSLDALCGVYCLINVIHFMNKLNKSEAQTLFIDILRFLEKKKRLSYIMKNGLRFKDMKSLFDHYLPKQHINCYLPFSKNAKLSIDEYWGAMQKFLGENEHSCIFLRVTGVLDHWTVVHLVTANAMYFSDSNHSHHMLRKSCMMTLSNLIKPHALHPAQTIFLRTMSKKG